MASKVVVEGGTKTKTDDTSPFNDQNDVKDMTNDQIIALFYRKVLSWDISNLAPHKRSIKPVKVSFDHRKDYISTFEPLLLEECRAQLERAIEEEDQASVPCTSRVRYISEHEDFLEVGLVFTNEGEMYNFHENDLMMVSLHHPMLLLGGDENEEMSDDDMDGVDGAARAAAEEEDPNKVVTTEDLKKKKKKVIPPSRTALTPENKYFHAIGTVEHFENGGIKVKFCLKNIHGDRGKQMNLMLRYSGDWWTTKLCNLSTLQREFLALYITSKTAFMNTLLLSDDVEKGLTMTVPPALYDQFKQTYNPSQFGALKAALDGNNITLIQGPPGTGKTHVIVGLISVLLNSTEVPKEDETTHVSRIGNRELFSYEKEEWWNISQPWLEKGYTNSRDDYTQIDYGFEEREEKRKRDLWRRLRETGSIKEAPRKRRILLCAPSNGAVDEIVGRLIRDGVFNHEGRKYHPNMVRVGPGSHADVERVTLEFMVRSRQQLMNSNTAIPSSSASTATATTSSKSNMDTNSVRSVILEDAEIIATTLSFSGSTLLTKMSGFDIVIIDEAAQAVETSTLVPIQHKCKKIILVGDPKQLPATIISPLAIKNKYDQSLFQRLQEKYPPHMLTTQYRMHSTIRAFPSQHFYNDLLEDGPNIPQRATDYHSNPFFGPLVFYDLTYSKETKHGGGSVFNEDECRMVFYLYQHILKSYPEQDFSGRVGIISPYRQQVLSLREYFKNCPGVSIDTVDGYQGREREIIIFSCVRAPEIQGSGIGFLADVRRMNVALTRPRSSLLIVGNTKSLSVNKDWNELIKHSQSNQCLIPIEGPNSQIEQIINTFTSAEKFDELREIGNAMVVKDPIEIEDLKKKKKKYNKRKGSKKPKEGENNNPHTTKKSKRAAATKPDLVVEA